MRLRSCMPATHAIGWAGAKTNRYPLPQFIFAARSKRSRRNVNRDEEEEEEEE